MASIQEEASGKKGGEIRYLTPLNIDHSTTTVSYTHLRAHET